MKHFTLGLFLMFFGASAQKPNILFSAQNLTEIIQDISSSDKLIMVDMTASWCKPCKDMERKVFTQYKVAAFFNRHFKSIKIYQDLDSIYPDPKEQLLRAHTRAFPTYYFLDQEGIMIDKIIGYYKAGEFIMAAKRVQKYGSTKDRIKFLKRKYKKEKHDFLFLHTLLELHQKLALPAPDVLEDFLKLIPKNKWLDPQIIQTIILHETNLAGAGYKFLADPKMQYKAMEQLQTNNEDEDIDGLMYEAALKIVQKNIDQSIVRKDQQHFESAITELKQLITDEAEAQQLITTYRKKFNSNL